MLLRDARAKWETLMKENKRKGGTQKKIVSRVIRWKT
jgi:hypothetical protein